MPLGLYISVPFCKTKCTYCNFASDVFSRAVFDRYIVRVCTEIEQARETAERMGGRFEHTVDSIYLGGGTPTLLEITQLERVFVTISQNFNVDPGAEITVECAPGTLSQGVVDTLTGCGVNRVSLGVQSFADKEAASVGRLHKRSTVIHDIAQLRSVGISDINVDLIAGLPHQTRESWAQSLNELIATGVPHASIYMLEVDEDSRLGSELIAGGQRYHAHFVPDDDLIADMYEVGCERLNAAGILQYEISNFARPGFESRHNLKYWTRQPYLGFGVDAHSMLRRRDKDASCFAIEDRGNGQRETAQVEPRGGERIQPRAQALGGEQEMKNPKGAKEKLTGGHGDVSVIEAIRFSTTDALESYIAGAPLQQTPVSLQAALQETFFLGLRLIEGVNLRKVVAEFGKHVLAEFLPAIAECTEGGLLEQQVDVIRLTLKGRLLSNEVFERFVSIQAGTAATMETQRHRRA